MRSTTSKLLLSIRLSYMSSNLTRQNNLSSREIVKRLTIHPKMLTVELVIICNSPVSGLDRPWIDLGQS